MILIANRVACTHVFHANCRANVARQNLADFFAFVGMHLEQPPNALTLGSAHVAHRIPGLELSGVDADKGQLANKRIGHNLERQRGERFLIGGLARNGLAIVGIRAMRFRHVERRRQVVDHSIQQRLHALVLE